MRYEMQLDKFTNKARNIISASQGIAAKNDHQQITPIHLLSAIMYEEDGIAKNIISIAGGDIDSLNSGIQQAISKIPKVTVSGGSQIYFSNESLKVLQAAGDLGKKSGDSFVTVERILEALDRGIYI